MLVLELLRTGGQMLMALTWSCSTALQSLLGAQLHAHTPAWQKSLPRQILDMSTRDEVSSGLLLVG